MALALQSLVKDKMKFTKYSSVHKIIWNEFVKSSKNGHFFFLREYMEYHSERFVDHSLLVFGDSEKLVAILPANLIGSVLWSHQGLTFGGFLVDDKIKTETMLSIFSDLKDYLTTINIEKLVYKSIPYIYHEKPAEEDRYALFIENANLIRRDITSTINLKAPIRYSKGRKWTINKAKKDQIEVIESIDFATFWGLLSDVLESNHGARPVHSLHEIVSLFNLFPKNIRLFLAKKNSEVIAGALIYENKDIVHTQYLANSDLGREIGGLDVLIDHLIKDKFQNKKYFDFGISNEDQGRTLNSGLISQKEGFGARAVAQDTYEIALS